MKQTKHKTNKSVCVYIDNKDLSRKVCVYELKKTVTGALFIYVCNLVCVCILAFTCPHLSVNLWIPMSPFRGTHVLPYNSFICNITEIFFSDLAFKKSGL